MLTFFQQKVFIQILKQLRNNNFYESFLITNICEFNNLPYKYNAFHLKLFHGV